MIKPINTYIKNITKNNSVFYICFLVSMLFSQIIGNDTNTMKKKQVSLDNINAEIESLENELNIEITNQINSEEKIRAIELEITKEKEVKLSNELAILKRKNKLAWLEIQ